MKIVILSSNTAIICTNASFDTTKLVINVYVLTCQSINLRISSERFGVPSCHEASNTRRPGPHQGHSFRPSNKKLELINSSTLIGCRLPNYVNHRPCGQGSVPRILLKCGEELWSPGAIYLLTSLTINLAIRDILDTWYLCLGNTNQVRFDCRSR